MQHRQYSSVVGDLILHPDEFSIFVPDSVMEGSKQHVLNCRNGNSRSSSHRHSVNTPPGAVDACATSHKAATERQDAGNVDDTYRSKGLMACSCRHDIPLFLCDIRTPGEQQHFAIALIGVLFQHLPPSATVGCLYDIGCVLDQSILKVCYLRASDFSSSYLTLDSTISYQNSPLDSLLPLHCSIHMHTNLLANLYLIRRSARALVDLMERVMSMSGHRRRMSLPRRGL
jgi:Kyakuja-Dileera-Zisupton transposase